MSTQSHLVLDIGTSSLRAAIVTHDARLIHETRLQILPNSPFAGAVEFDPLVMANAAVAAATQTLAVHGAVDSVGISCQ